MTIHTHDLKCWPKFYQAILDGDKSFEIRKDDRNFHVGDELLLREWDPITKCYTGRSSYWKIIYILASFEGLAPGFVALSIRPVKD
jgi:hypothetical protein